MTQIINITKGPGLPGFFVFCFTGQRVAAKPRYDKIAVYGFFFLTVRGERTHTTMYDGVKPPPDFLGSEFLQKLFFGRVFGFFIISGKIKNK